MKTNNWLKWLVVLLLIVNVSAIATMVYHQMHARSDESASPSFMFESEESLRYSGRWFRDELGLTKEQMREFSRFNPVFREKVRSINIDLNRVKMEMLREMNAEESNIETLNMLSDSIGNLHAELKKVTYSYYLEFKKIISPEQQEKLSQIFSGMFEGATPQGGAGRGMQGGRRFGWRRGN